MCSSENTVKLNVGGTVFETLKSTLTKHEGFFKTLLETGVPVGFFVQFYFNKFTFQVQPEKDDKNRFFIDRSPKHFETVLNYMRSGVAILPDSEKELRELKEEAEYYLLEDLAILSQPLKNKVRTYDSPHELLQFIANTRKASFVLHQSQNIFVLPFQPVVLINYLTLKNELVSVPSSFELNNFLELCGPDVEVYFREFFKAVHSLKQITGKSYRRN